MVRQPDLVIPQSLAAIEMWRPIAEHGAPLGTPPGTRRTVRLRPGLIPTGQHVLVYHPQEGREVRQAGADDGDRGLDGTPDEDGAHEPGDVEGGHEHGEIPDADNTGYAGAGINIGISSASCLEGGLTYKIPTAMIALMATFFRFVICSFRMRGIGMSNTIKSLNMLIIPRARKKVLTSMHVPFSPMNWFQ